VSYPQIPQTGFQHPPRGCPQIPQSSPPSLVIRSPPYSQAIKRCPKLCRIFSESNNHLCSRFNPKINQFSCHCLNLPIVQGQPIHQRQLFRLPIDPSNNPRKFNKTNKLAQPTSKQPSISAARQLSPGVKHPTMPGFVPSTTSDISSERFIQTRTWYGLKLITVSNFGSSKHRVQISSTVLNGRQTPPRPESPSQLSPNRRSPHLSYWPLSHSQTRKLRPPCPIRNWELSSRPPQSPSVQQRDG
jgi:hypothetical protein